MQVAFHNDKNGKPRAYRVDLRQMRYFPIGLDKAKLLVSTGKAERVAYRPFSKEKPNTGRRKAAPKPKVKILGQTVTPGTKRHAQLVQQKRHADDLQRHERNPAARKRRVRKSVPKKVVDAYRRLLGGTISPAAMKLIRKEYNVNPAGVVQRCMAKVRTAPKRRRNPGAEDAAADAYRDFHGHDPEVTIDVVTPVNTHSVLSGLGVLKSLTIRAAAKPIDITLSDFRGALLARPPNKRDKPQLYIEGGDQAVNLKDFGITEPHEFEVLGEVRDIVYHTNKTHLAPEDGGRANYEHKFKTGNNGEGKHVRFKSGRYPTAVYDVRNRLITLAGGTYEIPAEGING